MHSSCNTGHLEIMVVFFLRSKKIIILENGVFSGSGSVRAHEFKFQTEGCRVWQVLIWRLGDFGVFLLAGLVNSWQLR